MNTAILIQKGEKLVFEHLAIANGTLYFVDRDHVNKVPLAGGTPSVVLNSYGISYLTTDDKNVYVAGDCGLQKAPL